MRARGIVKVGLVVADGVGSQSLIKYEQSPEVRVTARDLP